MTNHDRASAARSPRRRRVARFRQHPQVDNGEFRRAAVADLSGHAGSGDRRACERSRCSRIEGANEIMPGLRTLHVARHGRRRRHFLLYRIVKGRTIEIGRILHDQMDLQLHVPFAADEDGQ